jgi:hypothetical protein
VFTERYSMRRWLIAVVAAVLAIAALLVWGLGLVRVSRATGYFSPIFAADGESLYVIRRTATATVLGPGIEFFTPPARVRLHTDRFSLLRVRLRDGQVSVLDDLPPSPLEGASLRAYHGAIFGTPHAHLRRTGARIEYEVGVTRHDSPLSRTFVVRRAYDATAGAPAGSPAWSESHPAMIGDEPAQLHGELEAIAVPGEEMMPCSVVLARNGESRARPLLETGVCRRKFPAGVGADAIASASRRAGIERAETLRTTYAELVERGKRAGLGEGPAMLEANKEMSRLGLYPKTTTLVAVRAECGSVSPLVRIAPEQFEVGLFPDIAEAIASPGKEVDKSMGGYIVHRDYTTSQELNRILEAGETTFHVQTRGACWKLTIDRPR